MLIARRTLLAAASLTAVARARLGAEPFARASSRTASPPAIRCPTASSCGRALSAATARVALGNRRGRSFTRVAQRGEARASIVNDFCVKVDVRGLAPGRALFLSLPLRLRPLAHRPHAHRAGSGGDSLTVALFSCANYAVRLFPRLRPRRARATISISCCTPATTSTNTSAAIIRAIRTNGAGPRIRSAHRDRAALGLLSALRRLSHRPRPAGAAAPEADVRRVGRSRDRQRHLARRRAKPSA